MRPLRSAPEQNPPQSGKQPTEQITETDIQYQAGDEKFIPKEYPGAGKQNQWPPLQTSGIVWNETSNDDDNSENDYDVQNC